jgi:hypothetical protein
LAVLICGQDARAARRDCPVLVELFTSQGCSDCPAADNVLSTWGADQVNKGMAVPLSYDVDYWDYLGWKDLFSAPAYSQRQRDYDSALGVGVYTPQTVVAGRSAFVGSDRDALEKTAARFQGGESCADIRIESVQSTGVKLSVTVDHVKAAKGELHVMLALFENGLTTKVLRGENGGSTLRNDFVVRRLVDLGTLPPKGHAFRRNFSGPWDPSWKKDRSGAAVFIQDAGTLAVLGASSLYPLKN